MPQFDPVRSAIVGLGGYAGAVRRLFENGHDRGGDHGLDEDAAGTLVAVAAPDLADHPVVVADLRARGVKVVESFEQLLAIGSVEAVWLPLPIDLHRSFTERALAAGKAVMCEKPAAGSVDDVDAMIEARDRAGLPVAIGYQDVYDPTTRVLKERLLGREIGKVRLVTVWACWPRADRYYNRSSWAGRLSRNGVWVLDSPANNALAHYINIALFLLGPTIQESATPEAVEAELYRVNPIENYDTIGMRVTLSGETQLLVLLTHACEKSIGPITTFHGDRGTVTRLQDRIELHKPGRDPEVLARGPEGGRAFMARRFHRLVRGVEDPEICLATLESSRPQTVVVSGASEATPIHCPPDSVIGSVPDDRGGTCTTIKGIESLFEQCIAQEKLLHESGLAAWTRPSGHRDLRDYRHFAGPASMRATAAR